MTIFNDFIWVKENSVFSKFCRDAIEKFEKSKDKVEGHIGQMTSGSPILNLDVKRSLDLYVSDKFDWCQINEHLHYVLVDSVKTYFDMLREKNINLGFGADQQIVDSGFQIQKTNPGEFYKWHNDFTVVGNHARILTYIWYLNDVNEGGETEFIDGTLIKPEEGKLMLFPATWTYIHQGRPPISNTKYICTGWIYFEY